MHFVIYQDNAKEWRWRLRRDGNFKTMADSGEGYVKKDTCVVAIGLFKKLVGSAPIYEN